eukprot:1148087-Pyramimonas_sp.AAC.1
MGSRVHWVTGLPVHCFLDSPGHVLADSRVFGLTRSVSALSWNPNCPCPSHLGLLGIGPKPEARSRGHS